MVLSSKPFLTEHARGRRCDVVHAAHPQGLQAVLLLLADLLERLEPQCPGAQLPLRHGGGQHPNRWRHGAAIARDASGVDRIISIADVCTVAKALDCRLSYAGSALRAGPRYRLYLQMKTDEGIYLTNVEVLRENLFSVCRIDSSDPFYKVKK